MAAVIVVWRRCVDCLEEFGLRRIECHTGLFAARRRCGACRPAHRRRLAAARARNYRLRRRHAESAISHPATSTMGSRANWGGVS